MIQRVNGDEPTGLGLGFRFPHAGEVLKSLPDVPWFEVIADDLLLAGGRLDIASKLRCDYPLALHSVGINIGGASRLDETYLGQLAELAANLQPCWMSDHLCWSSGDERQHFDLLPMPFSQVQLEHVVGRVNRVQEIFARPLLLENISYYVRFDHDEMSEWEFHAELCRRTGCGLLLDLNNLWTNCMNFGIDPESELRLALDTLDGDTIRQLHLAGSSPEADEPPRWIDTHGADVMDPVIDLYGKVSRRYPQIPAIIERDNALPPFSELKNQRDLIDVFVS